MKNLVNTDYMTEKTSMEDTKKQIQSLQIINMLISLEIGIKKFIEDTDNITSIVFSIKNENIQIKTIYHL